MGLTFDASTQDLTDLELKQKLRCWFAEHREFEGTREWFALDSDSLLISRKELEFETLLTCASEFRSGGVEALRLFYQERTAMGNRRYFLYKSTYKHLSGLKGAIYGLHHSYSEHQFLHGAKKLALLFDSEKENEYLELYHKLDQIFNTAIGPNRLQQLAYMFWHNSMFIQRHVAELVGGVPPGIVFDPNRVANSPRPRRPPITYLRIHGKIGQIASLLDRVPDEKIITKNTVTALVEWIEEMGDEFTWDQIKFRIPNNRVYEETNELQNIKNNMDRTGAALQKIGYPNWQEFSSWSKMKQNGTNFRAYILNAAEYLYQGGYFMV